MLDSYFQKLYNNKVIISFEQFFKNYIFENMEKACSTTRVKPVSSL